MLPQTAVVVTPVKLPMSGKGAFNMSMLLSKAEAKKEHLKQLELAVAWCAVPENGGAHKAAKVFPLTRSQIQSAINKAVDQMNGEQPERHQKEILTDLEQQKLADWIIASARNINPTKPAEVSDKVVGIPKARKAFNRAKGNNSTCILLTRAKQDLLNSSHKQVSVVWLKRTFIANHPQNHPKGRHCRVRHCG